MAPSLSNLLSVALVVAFAGLTSAKTVTKNFTANWVYRNPDGAFMRRTMAINGQWPLPVIDIEKGDRLIVNLYNELGDQDVSLHWHGIYQNGTTHMDGPAGVTQCPVPPGGMITYDFTVNQPGTYWYHSHIRGQYPDGLRGAFLVRDPESPYKDDYDEEVLLTLSDWYHDQMPDLLSQFISVSNPTGAEPVPNSALMNDTQNQQFMMTPGRRYFFRIVNMAAFAAQNLWFEGHTMEIIEVDGIYVQKQPANMIYVTAAQRYGVLITARNDRSENFAIVGSMDKDLFDTVPPGLNENVTTYLVYDDSKPLPKPKSVSEFNTYDDVNLVTLGPDNEIWGPPTQHYTMTMAMDNLNDGANYAFINGVTYVVPKVPTLYSVLTSGAMANDSRIYGINSQPFMLRHNEVVELVLNNNDPGKHPFHLHGHAFQTVYRSPENAGYYNSAKTPPSMFKQTPMQRDTLWVRPNGHFVIRFRSDNPGVWLYHCHLEWHVDSGLVATFIEAPMELQAQLQNKIPENHYEACRAGNTPAKGNAAGNTVSLLNLDGANLPPGPLPAGFTSGGIVALVFSCVSAFLGMVVIGWYGIKPIGSGEFAAAKKTIAEAGA